MDSGAALTLQIVCFLQADPDVPSSPARWALVPGSGRGAETFVQAAEHLAALEKPIVVGALEHPGSVAVWRAATLGTDERRHVEQTLASQQAALARMLGQLGIGDAALVRFEGWGAEVDVPVSSLRGWVREYVLTWGWTVGRPTDASHDARLRVLRGDDRWSPGGACAWPGPA